MKTLFVIGAALAGLAAVSSATTLTCGSDLIGYGTGTGAPIVCPTIGNPGDTITSISLTISSDYTGWMSGNPIVTFTYAIAGPVTFGAVPPQYVVTSFSGAVPNSIPVVATDIGNLGVGPLSGISVTPTSSVAGGTVEGSSSFVTLQYTSSPTVPEPATSALLGSGLLGLGLWRRRNRKK